MVGNDIVDIKEAKIASNWQRPRFLEKLFTAEEQFMIHKASNSFLKVWQLWSMKEAAYKLYTQMYPSRFYHPKGFECLIKEDFAIVKFKEFQCYVISKITSDYIISEARENVQYMTSKVVRFESNNAKNQSKTIRKAALQAGAKTLDISKENLRISFSKYGVPSMIVESKIVPLSFTHHGNYGAYAFSML